MKGLVQRGEKQERVESWKSEEENECFKKRNVFNFYEECTRVMENGNY